MSDRTQKIVMAVIAVISLVAAGYTHAQNEASQRGEDRATLRALRDTATQIQTVLSTYQQLLEDARVRLAYLEAVNRREHKETN
jgi:hypothetical protein